MGDDLNIMWPDHVAKTWRVGLKLHRTDGPAVEYPNGGKFYFQDDKRHRIDGPAKIYANGTVGWWLYGFEYPFDKFLELTPISPEEKCMLKLSYG